MRPFFLLCVYWCELEATLLGRIAMGGRQFLPSQIALAIGVLYLCGPIDLIPARLGLVGHLDELAFLVAGLVAAHKLMPARQDAPARTRAASSPAAVLPNFFIVGAPRCGTTSLFAALDHHPDVFCCPVKEPNHFATDRNARPAVLAGARRRGVLLSAGAPGLAVLPRVATTPDFDTYLGLFAGWSGQHAIGEASTSYLVSTTAAAEIARRQAEARIIVVLRQPVERTRSEYLMHTQLGREMTQATTAAQTREAAGDDAPASNDLVYAGDGEAMSLEAIIAASLYAPQIRRYLDVFRREQMLFLRFEDLAGAPAAVLRAVFTHIGVDPQAGPDIALSHQNQSRSLRFPWLNRLLFKSGLRDVILHGMPASVRRRLARRYYGGAAPPAAGPAIPSALFRADIAETARLTGLDLSGWLRA